MLCPDLPPRIYESLKTLCCLASSGKPLQAQEIAAATHLPPSQTAKILQQMAWGGFVDSQRGAKGGFWLVRPAARIRVAEVVAFFSHPVKVSRRHDPMLLALARVTARCRKEFSRITIADLGQIPACKTIHGPGGKKSLKVRSRV